MALLCYFDVVLGPKMNVLKKVQVGSLTNETRQQLKNRKTVSLQKFGSKKDETSPVQTLGCLPSHAFLREKWRYLPTSPCLLVIFEQNGSCKEAIICMSIPALNAPRHPNCIFGKAHSANPSDSTS